MVEFTLEVNPKQLSWRLFPSIVGLGFHGKPVFW